MDKSYYSKIVNCEVYTIGMEGIHLRDGSSNCSVETCSIRDCGLDTPWYDEGVYVGMDKGLWDMYDQTCFAN